jgi:hypothetical protein
MFFKYVSVCVFVYVYLSVYVQIICCGSVYFATGHEAVESKQSTKNRTDLIISYSDSDARLWVQILLVLTLRTRGILPLLSPHAFVALC